MQQPLKQYGKWTLLWLIMAFFYQSLSAQPPAKTFDPQLYSLILKQVETKGLWENRSDSIQVRIDPKPLANTTKSSEEIAFIPADSRDLEKYTSLILDHSLQPTDMNRDMNCLYIEGLKPPSIDKMKNDHSLTEYCKAIGNFVTIAFTLPRLVATDTSEQRFAIEAVEISGYTFGVFDLFFEKQEDGSWIFIKKEERLFVMS